MKKNQHLFKLIRLEASIWHENGPVISERGDLVMILSYKRPHAKLLHKNGAVTMTCLNRSEQLQL